MKITYLNHSGFLLEWEKCYWIFDYFKGEIPALNPEKEIFIFSSHSHHDHFNPEIFALAEQYPSTTYIFSSEIQDTFEKPDNNSIQIHYLEDRKDYSIATASGSALQIHTLKSTDLGCAFYVAYEGKTIYHAGDLHWWYWEGEPEDWNTQMTADYKKEMEFLEGKSIDLVFTPLDPRQEKDYALGMNYLLEHTHTHNVFPMHFWDDFTIIDKYLAEYPISESTRFYSISQNGQSFEIML